MPDSFTRRDAIAVLGAAGVAAAEGRAQDSDAMSGAPHDLPRVLENLRTDTGSLFVDAERLSKRQGFPASFLGNRWKNAAEYQREGRKLVFGALGGAPPSVQPRAEVVARQDLGSFTREKIVFSTTPEMRVPAYLHLPKAHSGRLPAIVDLHSHGGMFLFGKEKVIDFGVNHPAMVPYHRANYEGRPTATELVKRGYAVITIDAFGFGERRILLEEDRDAGWERGAYSQEDVVRLNQKCRAKESTIVKTLTYAGYTWPGVVAWDDIRTVDFLLSRPEIDPARIGCVGVSMGGWRSLLLAGLDSRIRAGVVVGFMSTARPMMERHMDTHSFVHFIPGVHAQLDLPDIVALRAPLPLLVQQCKQDGLFPLKGMEESIEKLSAIYRKAGRPESFEGRFYDQKHIFNVEMQNDAFAWLDKHLKA
ncbi:MAG: acetylxylan esterase [Bryobacterales bacterium]|nr:acetylxylan esterase [Bryobacterales bacterium]